MSLVVAPADTVAATSPEEPTAPGPRSRPLALPAVITVVLTAAYLSDAGRALDYDSAQMVGANIRTSTFGDALTVQTLFNNHPFFSLVERLVVALTGSSSDVALRVAPAVFGAAAVALLVAVLRPDLGTRAALCAGALMATNPTVVDLTRGVRGYSLLLLATVASTAALARLVTTPEGEAEDRRLVAVWVVAVAVGLGTHLYMVPVLAAHGAVVLARRRLSHAWVQRGVVALVLGASCYTAVAGIMVEGSRSGTRTFFPRMPLEVAEISAARGWPGLLLAGVLAAGAVTLRHRLDLGLATVVVLGGLAVNWAVLASPHLSARFHVFLVPAVAALAAVAVHRWPVLVVAVGLVVAVHLTEAVDGHGSEANALPEAGRIVERAHDAGLRGCVTDLSVRPIDAYADAMVPVISAEDIDGCDVVVVPFPASDPELVTAARARLPVERPLPSTVAGGMVFATDTATATQACASPRGVCTG